MKMLKTQKSKTQTHLYHRFCGYCLFFFVIVAILDIVVVGFVNAAVVVVVVVVIFAVLAVPLFTYERDG